MLKKSPVIFNELNHTYWLNGEQLSGITSILDRQLFPHKYDGVNKETLDKAAEYGSKVHADIELYNSLGISDDAPHVQEWKKLADKHNLEVLASEYLVSDEDYVASSIDIVMTDYTLADIKTTSKLDKDYVSWQLSIYAYLFELQNPTIKVPQLLAIWLPQKQYGKPKVVKVKRLPDEDIIRLLATDKKGEQFIPAVAEETALAIPPEVIESIKAIKREAEEIKRKEKELSEGLLKKMQEYDIKKFEVPGFSMTRKLATTRESFDSKAFKEQYPDLYEQFIVTSEVKESILIKIS